MFSQASDIDICPNIVTCWTENWTLSFLLAGSQSFPPQHCPGLCVLHKNSFRAESKAPSSCSRNWLLSLATLPWSIPSLDPEVCWDFQKGKEWSWKGLPFWSSNLASRCMWVNITHTLTHTQTHTYTHTVTWNTTNLLKDFSPLHPYPPLYQ